MKIPIFSLESLSSFVPLLSQNLLLFHMVSSITNMLQPLEQSPPSSFVECISKLHEKVHVRRIPQSMHSTIHRYEPFQCFFSMLMFNIICNQHIASYSIDRNQSIRILRQALVAHIFEPFQSFFNQKNEKTTPEIDNLSSPLKKSASTPTPSSLILIQNTIDLLHLACIIYLADLPPMSCINNKKRVYIMSSPLMIASVSTSTTLILMEKTENVLPIVDFNHLPFADYHKGKRHLQQAKRKEDDDNLSSPLKNASTPAPSSLILLS